MQKIILLSLVGLCLLSGCGKNMPPAKIGNIDSTQKVLITGQTSKFKEKVIGKVIETLEPRGYYFEIINANKLDKEETGQYGAVLLVTTVMAGKIDKQITRFLQKDPGNPKVIVFYTMGDENHPPPELGIKVDAVTSASLSDRVDKRANQLITLIKDKF